MELTAMKSFNQSLNMHEMRNHERFRMIWRAVSKRFLESETIRSNYWKTVYHGGEERDKPGTNSPLDTFPQNGLEKRPFLWQKQDGRSIVNLVIDDAREWTKVALKYWYGIFKIESFLIQSFEYLSRCIIEGCSVEKIKYTSKRWKY